MKHLILLLLFVSYLSGPMVAYSINPAPLDAPPAAPSGLALSYDYYTIDLAWNDNATNESGFVVYRQYEGEDFGAIDTLAANSESYSDRIPYRNSLYSYYVVAYNSLGESDSSNVEALQIYNKIPNQPVNVTLEALSYGEVRISWENEDSTATHFNISRSDSPTGEFQTVALIGIFDHSRSNHGNAKTFPIGMEMNYLDVGPTYFTAALQANTNYYYKISASAYNGKFSDPSDSSYDSNFWESQSVYEVTTLGTEPDRILAPSEMFVSTDNPHKIELSWNNNAENATSFEVYRALKEEGPYSLAHQIPAKPYTSSRYYRLVDEGLDPITNYFYKVRAVSDDNYSIFSNTVSTNTYPTPPVLLPIEDMVVKEGETSTIEISVEDPPHPHAPLYLFHENYNDLEFISFINHGNGTGTLTVSPSIGDTGVYQDFIHVVDPYSQYEIKGFTMVVKPAESGDFNTVLFRVNSGYTALADSPINWSTDIRTNRSPYFNPASVNTSAGWNYFAYANPTNAPNVLFGSQRIGYSWGPAMEYSFPVEGAVEVTLFFAERGTEVTAAGQRVFNINMEGLNVETNFDIYAEAGRNAISKTYYAHVSDGSLDVILDRVIGNPLISGIEIRGNTNTVNAMAAKGFSGQIAKTAMDEDAGEGIEEAVVYPNPFTEGLTIALPYDFTRIEYLAVMDGAGRVVYQQTAFEPGNTLALEAYRLNLARGLYYLIIKPAGAPKQNFKIIKQ